MHDFERDADTCQVLVRVWTIVASWVDDSVGDREGFVRLVVVGYHEVDPTFHGAPRGFHPREFSALP